MAGNIKQTTERIAGPILEELGLELVEVEYVKEGKNYFLRVYIDSDKGIDLDDCAAVSERLSEELDKEDPIEDAYYLEVSSPGAERPLKNETDLSRAVGKNVHVTTYAPVDGEKMFEGRLTGFDGETLTIEITVKTRTRTVQVPYDKVAKARLAVII
ncbi:ribosome maturation factor RimP [Alteribacter natronophilus]|uniref:ribosome maturation factor RimP n=1 Tax=Alteribacter natronophilus TaxID=2583810 RepID=UPI00110E2BA6|nr:ribosome maturation factor RimP [Alteribacter natronophilus]TMW73244.1 ribosome maturation factor RimP [Alteribacter natronophilus]